MSKIPVSVCMIAKNEERYLEGCLQKLLPYGFEIILVDTGSTDRTMEIAAKYTDKIYEFPWIDDFSAARNYSAKQASNDWILALDCDEYIESIDLENILEIISLNEKIVGRFKIENLVSDGNGVGKSYHNVSRLYNKKYCLFEGLIHEQIVSINKEIMQYVSLPINIKHYGYNLTKEENLEKNNRYISLLLKAIERNPKEPYYYFQLGKSYAMLDDYEKVYQYLHTALQLEIRPNAGYLDLLLIEYGNAMIHTKRHELAMRLEMMQDRLSEYADYHLLMGKIYHMNNLPLKALGSLVKATTCSKIINCGTNTYFPLNVMSIIYEQMGEKKMADDCKKQAEKLVLQSLDNEEWKK